MKMEARQHGMVRTYPVIPLWYPNPKTRTVQKLESLLIARLFPNVPSRPSNNSKITGKCGRPYCFLCHLNPVSKSKDKIEGTQKLRTSNKVVSPKWINWWVMDRPGLNFFGFSASRILEHLYSANEDDEIDDHVDDHHDDYDTCATFTIVNDDDDDFMANFWSVHEKEIEEHVDDDNKDDDDDDDFMANFWSLHEKEIEEHSDYDCDDAMSFCDDGFMLDQSEEDEGWYLLKEL